jgi:hypothetical protein
MDTVFSKVVKERAKCKVVPYPYGVVVFKNCLDEKGQKDILNACMELTKVGGNEKLLPKKAYERESKAAVPFLFYNWPGHRTEVIEEPTNLLQFAEKVLTLIHNNKILLEILLERLYWIFNRF